MLPSKSPPAIPKLRNLSLVLLEFKGIPNTASAVVLHSVELDTDANLVTDNCCQMSCSEATVGRMNFDLCMGQGMNCNESDFFEEHLNLLLIYSGKQQIISLSPSSIKRPTCILVFQQHCSDKQCLLLDQSPSDISPKYSNQDDLIPILDLIFKTCLETGFYSIYNSSLILDNIFLWEYVSKSITLSKQVINSEKIRKISYEARAIAQQEGVHLAHG